MVFVKGLRRWRGHLLISSGCSFGFNADDGGRNDGRQPSSAMIHCASIFCCSFRMKIRRVKHNLGWRAVFHARDSPYKMAPTPKIMLRISPNNKFFGNLLDLELIVVLCWIVFLLKSSNFFSFVFLEFVSKAN